MDYVRIAFCGKMRSGKNLAANIIADRIERDMDRTVTQLAFADEVRNKVYTEFPEFIGTKPRKALQIFGSMYREIDPGYWVKQIATKVEILDTAPIIITDCRFKNEADWLRKNGFFLVKIVTPDDIRLKRIQQTEPDTKLEDMFHVTESEIDDIMADFTLTNSDSLEVFNEKLITMYTYFYKQYGYVASRYYREMYERGCESKWA